MQPDGRVVLYEGDQQTWEFNDVYDSAILPFHLDIQPDGNVVLYDADRPPGQHLRMMLRSSRECTAQIPLASAYRIMCTVLVPVATRLRCNAGALCHKPGNACRLLLQCMFFTMQDKSRETLPTPYLQPTRACLATLPTR